MSTGEHISGRWYVLYDVQLLKVTKGAMSLHEKYACGHTEEWQGSMGIYLPHVPGTGAVNLGFTVNSVQQPPVTCSYINLNEWKLNKVQYLNCTNQIPSVYKSQVLTA
jgi:hypothetical protein